MTQTADAVVVGAGVVGASTAFHLARPGAHRVVVCERRQPAAGASGRSAAFIQLHFCLNEAEARLTLASQATFGNWAEMVGTGTSGFVQAGYVRLEGPAYDADLRTKVAMLRGIGVNTSVIGPDELRALAPYLRTDDVALAAYEPESGHADPLATVDGFLAAAKRLGCDVWLDAEVREVRSAGGRVIGVETSRGPVATPVVVLAAGVWSKQLLDALDLEVPLLGARTQVARFRRSSTSREPVVNVGDGIAFAYFHSAGEAYQDVLVGLSGGARRPLHQTNLYDDSLDLDYAQTCLDRLKWRLPAAADTQLVGGASGPITLTPDNLPIIDRHPALDGLYVFAGDSGSSFKTSPAVGRALAEWALLGSPRVVDVSAFNLARFNTPHPAWSTDSDYYRLRSARRFTVCPAESVHLDEARALMLRTFELDFGYGYRPDYHADVDDLQGEYLDNPRHVLLVAVDHDSGDVIGTAAVRSGGLKPAFNPPWLVERYDPWHTAQIVRVYVAREHRRRGVAQALVKAAYQFVADDGSYTRIALHTDPRSPGAERFWTVQATNLIYDDRDGPSGSIHFEVAIPTPSARPPQDVRVD